MSHSCRQQINLRKLHYKFQCPKLSFGAVFVFCRCKILHGIPFWKNHEGGVSPRETCRQEWLITFAPRCRFPNENNVGKLRMRTFIMEQTL